MICAEIKQGNFAGDAVMEIVLWLLLCGPAMMGAAALWWEYRHR